MAAGRSCDTLTFVQLVIQTCFLHIISHQRFLLKAINITTLLKERDQRTTIKEKCSYNLMRRGKITMIVIGFRSVGGALA